jgi:hypothetical protein
VNLAGAALAVAAALAVMPAFGAGTGMPIALGAGVGAVVFTAWTLLTGATPPLIIASLLFVIEIGGVVVLGHPPVALSPFAATGLYLLVELCSRSLERRGRWRGWRSFGVIDGVQVAGVTAAVGLMTWLVTIVSTRPDLPGGIFMHGVAIAAATAVIGVVWLLIRRASEL